MIIEDFKVGKLIQDFKDSCRRIGGEIEESATEVGCKVPQGEFFLKIPKNSLYGNFRFETRDGKKIGVIFDYRTIDII